MPRIQIETDQARSPTGAFSQGIIANGFLFTAGFGPHDPATGEIIGDTIQQQTRQAMKNLTAVLAVHSLDFSHVVKATVHLQELKRDSAGFNEIYNEFAIDPFPVRTTVGSDLANILVEIDVVAICE
jgi:2-iminobutanoate/2-iminopropanoate deaminase